MVFGQLDLKADELVMFVTKSPNFPSTANKKKNLLLTSLPSWNLLALRKCEVIFLHAIALLTNLTT